jgi:UDP-3-O-[3-hydroxymyristoyl] N-acetylglucosamine deacetylase
VFLIECAGLKRLQRPRRVLQILDEIEIVDGDKRVALRPSDRFAIGFEIDFDAEAIGRQAHRLDITQASFKSEIARARTFGFLHELEHLNANGLARGGSLDNAVVLNGGKVLNRGGLRYRDEFVRHKILDAIGDLALAGLPIIGAYEARRAGHGLNNRLLRALFDTPTAYEIVTTGVHRMPVSPEFEAAVA